MVSQLSLSDSKSLQVSSSRLSILVDLYNAAVWLVSTRPLISKYSSLSSNFFCDCTLRANYKWCHCHSYVPHFFQISWYLSFFSIFFSVTKWSAKTASPLFSRFSFLLLTITMSGRLAGVRWSFVPQNPIEVCASHFSVRILSSAYTTCSYLQI